MADYSIEDKEEMIKANVARLNAHKSRLQELIEFIKVSGGDFAGKRVYRF